MLSSCKILFDSQKLENFENKPHINFAWPYTIFTMEVKHYNLATSYLFKLLFGHDKDASNVGLVVV